MDSYGRLKLNKGESGSCPFRYQGQYEDVETGLYYNRFRYYSPEEGLYISQDPIGLQGGIEFYSYVHDPNTWIDPLGLSGTCQDELDILEAEYNGGHSLEKHGSHLPLSEMETRVLGTHPTMNQSRSALKFDTDAIHQDAVNKAYSTHKADIDAHFASGGGYKEWDFDYGSQVGTGYTNTGTRRNPILVPVTSEKVRIAMAPDGNGGYNLDSAYPNV